MAKLGNLSLTNDLASKTNAIHRLTKSIAPVDLPLVPADGVFIGDLPANTMVLSVNSWCSFAFNGTVPGANLFSMGYFGSAIDVFGLLDANTNNVRTRNDANFQFAATGGNNLGAIFGATHPILAFWRGTGVPTVGAIRIVFEYAFITTVL